MKLVIFSDIHYASKPPLHKSPRVKRKLTDLSLPLIKKLIDNINNSIKPDVVINIGDSIEDWQDHNQDIENFNFIWNILKTIKVPFYSTIGNTEARSIKRDKIEEIMEYDSITFSVDINDYHLVFLGINASYNDDGTYNIEFSNEDLEWLRNDLEKNTLRCLIFTHYGIAEDDMKCNWWYETNPKAAVLQERKEIKKIIEKDTNILAVFSGHQHWTKAIIENDIQYYVVGSLTEDIKSDGVPDGVYFEVELQGNMINVKENHLKLENYNIIN